MSQRHRHHRDSSDLAVLAEPAHDAPSGGIADAFHEMLIPDQMGNLQGFVGP
jgi:hypothetical protein